MALEDTDAEPRELERYRSTCFYVSMKSQKLYE